MQRVIRVILEYALEFVGGEPWMIDTRWAEKVGSSFIQIKLSLRCLWHTLMDICGSGNHGLWKLAMCYIVGLFINSFNLHSNLTKCVLFLVFQYYRWGNWVLDLRLPQVYPKVSKVLVSKPKQSGPKAHLNHCALIHQWDMSLELSKNVCIVGKNGSIIGI